METLNEFIGYALTFVGVAVVVCGIRGYVNRGAVQVIAVPKVIAGSALNQCGPVPPTTRQAAPAAAS